MTFISTILRVHTAARAVAAPPRCQAPSQRLAPRSHGPVRFRGRAPRAPRASNEDADAPEPEDAGSTDSSSSFHRLDRMSDRRSGKAPKDMSPKEQVRESLAQAARLQGRDAGTKGVQVVMGDEDDMDKWKELDARVNEYPAWRNFKAIGEGGDDFRDSVVALVGAALGESVGEDCVRVRPSSGGKYVAVDVGPVLVKKPEDVVAVFTELRKEPRIRWWM